MSFRDATSLLPRSRAGVVLLAGPLAALVAARGVVLPTVITLGFVAALTGVAVLGLALQALISGPHDDEPGRVPTSLGLFQLLWLGQYALLGLAFACGLPVWLLHAALGLTVPLRVVLPCAALAVVVWRRHDLVRMSRRATGPELPSILLASAVGFALFRAVSLHARSAGPLGYDTQQHIFWAQQIADEGYLALTARSTDMIESYPRVFHLLAASWAAMGFTDVVGPFVKLMPMLQAVLSCGFLCELLITLSRAEPGAERAPVSDPLKALLLGAFVCWHLTFGDGQDVVRAKDLSGTPRFSADWVVYCLPLLVVAQRAGQLGDARAWLVGAVPVLAALAPMVNPVVAVLFVAFSLPLALGLALLLPAVNSRGPVPWRRALAYGASLALLVTSRNTFVIAQVADRYPAFARWLAAWFGLRTAELGEVGTAWTDYGARSAPLCMAGGPLGCAVELGTKTAQGVSDVFSGVYGEGELTTFANMKHSAVYWAVFVVPFVALAVVAIRRGDEVRVGAARARAFVGLAAALLLASVPAEAVRALLDTVAPGGPTLRLLAGYFTRLDMLLAPFSLCLIALASWTCVDFSRSLTGRRLVIVATVALTAVFGMVRLYRPSALIKHRWARKEARIDWPELRAIDLLNRFVPDGERILVRSRHVVRHNYEHLMITDDSAGVILPRLRKPFLFGLGIGPSVDYGWPELEHQFCGNARERSALLQATNTRWVLVRDPRPAARETYDELRWECGVTLADLGAEFPPRFAERDLALYRLPAQPGPVSATAPTRSSDAAVP